MMKKQKIEDWVVPDAVRTLQRAEEIKSDPVLMPLVRRELVKTRKALGKLSKSIGAKDG